MKKEYWKREARRITAAVLALLLCVSVFAQTLPRAYAAETKKRYPAAQDMYEDLLLARSALEKRK